MGILTKTCFKIIKTGEYLDTLEEHKNFIESNTEILKKYGNIVGIIYDKK